VSSGYPAGDAARDHWILARRPPRNVLEPLRAYAAHVEPEISESGEPVDVATIFLTNRECPWRCLMCDLWKNTLEKSVPRGAIAAQIREALATLPPARRVKLYNAGSFFDPHAIPSEDHAEIAEAVSAFERVIVESHPSLVGGTCLRFRDRIAGRLEVALGLETVHPDVLPRLNKRMTLEGFAEAAAFLRDGGIGLRVFVLAGLPFLDEAEGLEATRESIVWAFDHGASVVSVIPTRAGNGALDDLAARGEFAEPSLSALEDAVVFGLGLRRGRVFADLWDLERFRSCRECFAARVARLSEMNRRQRPLPRTPCPSCEGAS
jgi:radical SAM enzyme (TIGR01210 family)